VHQLSSKSVHTSSRHERGALRDQDPPENNMLPVLLLLFFASGFAALTYQVCWQRLLAYAFGVDIESSTIVIACFMLGMGVGSLVGGYVADRTDKPLRWFCAAEMVIALFGIASPSLINLLANIAADLDRVAFAVSQFMLLLIPTSMMGATLPLLVVELRRRNQSVAKATGTLYFVNTLGAAFGAFTTGLWMFNHMEIGEVVAIAAVCNVAVGMGGLLTFNKSGTVPR
jgi:predicted membrane-bound spermidine synthase